MAREIDQEPASFARRSGAFVIDAVIVAFIWFGAIILAVIPDSNSDAEEVAEPWDTIATIVVLALPAFWFVYQLICNALGVSMGKKLFGLSIRLRGSTARPGLWLGLLRTVGQLVGAVPLGLGFWAALWDPDNAAWHDRLAGTRVVRRGVEGEGVRSMERDGIRRRIERHGVRERIPAAEVKNLRFLCDSAPDATGPAYVELRREGIRFEQKRSLRGVPYWDIERASIQPSGQIELRFKSRDMFDRPSHETLMLSVQDREQFLLELDSRVEAATGGRLGAPREPPGLQPPPT